MPLTFDSLIRVLSYTYSYMDTASTLLTSRLFFDATTYTDKYRTFAKFIKPHQDSILQTPREAMYIAGRKDNIHVFDLLKERRVFEYEKGTVGNVLCFKLGESTYTYPLDTFLIEMYDIVQTYKSFRVFDFLLENFKGGLLIYAIDNRLLKEYYRRFLNGLRPANVRENILALIPPDEAEYMKNLILYSSKKDVESVKVLIRHCTPYNYESEVRTVVKLSNYDESMVNMLVEYMSSHDSTSHRFASIKIAIYGLSYKLQELKSTELYESKRGYFEKYSMNVYEDIVREGNSELIERAKRVLL